MTSESSLSLPLKSELHRDAWYNNRIGVLADAMLPPGPTPHTLAGGGGPRHKRAGGRGSPRNGVGHVPQN
jgi:hypothetical protein